jgi:hypothetical protein
MMPIFLSQFVTPVARRPYLGLLGMIFYPVLTTLALGQSSILLLVILTLGYLLLSRNRDFAAGLVLALAAIKFQYVLIIVGLLVIGRRSRLMAGFALGCMVLFTICIGVIGVDGLIRYFEFLRDYNLNNGYDVRQLLLMANWRGFFMGMGWTNHIRLFSAVASGACLALGIVVGAFSNSYNDLDLKFSLYVAIALIASPYAHFPDVTILLLPLYLAINSTMSDRITGWRRIITLICCGLLFVGPIILLISGGHYWWNSRIYLMFPVIFGFVAVMATSLLKRDPHDFRQTARQSAA